MKIQIETKAKGGLGVLTIYANHPDGNFRHKYEMIKLDI